MPSDITYGIIQKLQTEPAEKTSLEIWESSTERTSWKSIKYFPSILGGGEEEKKYKHPYENQ